jgi:hypothetical protein
VVKEGISCCSALLALVCGFTTKCYSLVLCQNDVGRECCAALSSLDVLRNTNLYIVQKQGLQQQTGVGACRLACCVTNAIHQEEACYWECLLHVSTFATTRVALPTGVKPG